MFWQQAFGEGHGVDERGWGSAYQQYNNDGLIESVREDMLTLAVLLADSVPEVADRVRSTPDDPRRELTYALGERWMSANFDVKQDLLSVRDGLESLKSYPAGTRWEWHPDFLAEYEDWDCGDRLEVFLEYIGESLRERGFALVSLPTFSDDYDFVVIREADLVARRSGATDRWCQIVQPGTFSRTVRRLADRNAVGRRAVMSQWDRFAEDLAVMLRKQIGASVILDFRVSETVWVQMNQIGIKRLAVGMEPSMFAENDPSELASEGWTLSDDEWEHDNWWEITLSNVPNVCDSIARRLVTALRRSGVGSPEELTAEAWEPEDHSNRPTGHRRK
ncbi:hypothetical protein ACIRRA_39115 [Nocardia sp. NPDC101769]|uniref:DUF6630 family protein n=1 Tax=Nocardia sp. NPDC101769 TaxID=3364333 RepID=UPI0037FA3C91